MVPAQGTDDMFVGNADALATAVTPSVPEPGDQCAGPRW